MHALLLNLWIRREKLNPELCFDKHDGRWDRTIYHPPQRQQSGIVMPSRLAGTEEMGVPGAQGLNIFHHHVSIRPEQHIRQDSVYKKSGPSFKRRKLQATLQSCNKPMLHVYMTTTEYDSA